MDPHADDTARKPVTDWRRRRPSPRARSAEWAVVTTIGLLLACWAMLVL